MINIIKDLCRPVYHKIIVMIYFFFRLFPIKKNKIVITNYYGKGFGDNGKAIANELHERKLDIDFVWLVEKNDESIPQWIRQVNYYSILSIYELVTAKLWIDNARKRRYVRKRKQQFYIQTWHGTIPLKRVEKDVEAAFLRLDFIKSEIIQSRATWVQYPLVVATAISGPACV